MSTRLGRVYVHEAWHSLSAVLRDHPCRRGVAGWRLCQRGAAETSLCPRGVAESMSTRRGIANPKGEAPPDGGSVSEALLRPPLSTRRGRADVHIVGHRRQSPFSRAARPVQQGCEHPGEAPKDEGSLRPPCPRFVAGPMVSRAASPVSSRAAPPVQQGCGTRTAGLREAKFCKGLGSGSLS